MKFTRKQHRCRPTSGLYLLETLVALILSTMFAYTLLNMLSETLRLTSSNRKNQAADFMIQTTLDSVKRFDRTTWQSLPIGSYILLDKGEPVMAPVTIAVGPNMDALTPKWTDRSMRNKFTGQVVLNIQPGTTPSGKVAVVSVLFDANPQGRKIATLTALHAAGVNFWPE